MLNILAFATHEGLFADLLASCQTLKTEYSLNRVKDFSTLYSQFRECAPQVLILDIRTYEEPCFSFIHALYEPGQKPPDKIFILHSGATSATSEYILDSRVHGFFQYPTELPALTRALEECNLPALKETRQKPLGKLITFFSCKGGAGATTVALNVAHELRQLTQEATVLLDLDQLYNNIAMRLNLQPDHGLGELSQRHRSEIDTDLFDKLITHRPESVDLLTCHKDIMDQQEMIPLWLLGQTLDFLRARYRYVLVDLPSYVLDTYHQYLAERSDELILVSTLDLPALYRTRQYLQLAKHHLGKHALRLVLNRCNLAGAHGISNADLEKEFAYPIYQRLADNWPLTLKANSLGVLMHQIDPAADLIKDIQKLTSRLADLEIPEPLREANEGLLSKIANLNFNFNVLMKGA